MATKEEKIKAIVKGTANGLYMKEVEEQKAKSTDYEHYWDGINWADIEKCALQEGISSNLYFSKPGPEDGMYLLKSKSSWSLYRQERGSKYKELTYTSKDEALNKLLEMMAASFGIFKTEN